jgi:hypothetical protein
MVSNSLLTRKIFGFRNKKMIRFIPSEVNPRPIHSFFLVFWLLLRIIVPKTRPMVIGKTMAYPAS